MPAVDAFGHRATLRLAFSLIALGAVAPAHSVRAADAIVLLYHHVAPDTPRSTSVTPESFDRHLDYLASNGYTIVSLERIVESLRGGTPLPENAVALTFDDGYRSIYTAALPRLERRSWPFTVFVSTDAIDAGYSNFMSWDELRDLERRGASIANHGTDHAHLIRRRADETETAWRERIRGNILDAQARLEAELVRPSRFFAYPYGEFDTSLESLLSELDRVAFGQQSGPIGAQSSLQALPRYPMATGFDSVAGLAEKLRTRALPVAVLAPSSRVLAARAQAPELRLRFAPGPYRRDALMCYVAGQEPAAIAWEGDTARIRARAALGPGRSKYNCTAPATSERGVFYWYSHLWIQPRDDGSWYAE